MKEENYKYKVEKGRPADTAGRAEHEIAVYDMLDKLGIEYDRVDHEPTDTMEACRGIDEVLGMGMEICKNIFLCNRQKTEFYLLMMPGMKSLKTKQISPQIGCSRLSFADESYMVEFLKTTPGSASVMGLMFDKEHRVRLLVDEDLMRDTYLGCHPCMNTSSLKMKMSDLFEKFLPETGHEPTIIRLGEAYENYTETT